MNLKPFLGSLYYRLFLRLSSLASAAGANELAWKLHSHVSYRAFSLMRGEW